MLSSIVPSLQVHADCSLSGPVDGNSLSTYGYRPQRDFLAELAEQSVSAVNVAVSYLGKGPGRYHPSPPLSGVDYVDVTCLRQFGVITHDLRALRLLFEEQWNSAPKRRKIIDTFDPRRVRDRNDKAWFLAQWMKHADEQVRHQHSSGEFEVRFCGPAGRWAAVFSVGCVAFTNTPFIFTETPLDYVFD